MARFAFDCQSRMHELVAKLELCLGPNTADLTIRFGMHSGPLTASILRGVSARFRLFGDTVSVAATMER
jgi:class 3 adenylate cyclase